jgi:hypothetical protein
MINHLLYIYKYRYNLYTIYVSSVKLLAMKKNNQNVVIDRLSSKIRYINYRFLIFNECKITIRMMLMKIK